MLRTIRRVVPGLDEHTVVIDTHRGHRSPWRRGALHGIPIFIKENIGTADQMETTAGPLALIGARPKRDADLVAARTPRGR